MWATMAHDTILTEVTIITINMYKLMLLPHNPFSHIIAGLGKKLDKGQDHDVACTTLV